MFDRMSGGFPFPMWGLGPVQAENHTCALCGKSPATLFHVILTCPGSAKAWGRAVGAPGRPPKPWSRPREEFFRQLLEDGDQPAERVQKMRIIAKVLTEYS